MWIEVLSSQKKTKQQEITWRLFGQHYWKQELQYPTCIDFHLPRSRYPLSTGHAPLPPKPDCVPALPPTSTSREHSTPFSTPTPPTKEGNWHFHPLAYSRENNSTYKPGNSIHQPAKTLFPFFVRKRMFFSNFGEIFFLRKTLKNNMLALVLVSLGLNSADK